MKSCCSDWYLVCFFLYFDLDLNPIPDLFWHRQMCCDRLYTVLFYSVDYPKVQFFSCTLVALLGKAVPPPLLWWWYVILWSCKCHNVQGEICWDKKNTLTSLEGWYYDRHCQPSYTACVEIGSSSGESREITHQRILNPAHMHLYYYILFNTLCISVDVPIGPMSAVWHALLAAVLQQQCVSNWDLMES